MVVTPNRTNPFPGLRPFELDEEHLFFGREGQSDELIRRLHRTRFLGVVGTSGSGKSSLVRAGLLPSLYSGFLPGATSSWRIAVLRPGSAPMYKLATALNDPDVFGVSAAHDEAVIRRALTESTLRRGSLGLVEVTQQARLAPDESLLVVVDQFEELFRFKAQAAAGGHYLEAEDEAAAFVKLLLAAVNQRTVPIFVVLTMRSDFLGDCAQFRDLPETLNDSQYLIPRLTRDQLRRAIEGPVAVGGATITPRLVNRLLNDTGDNPDQLPILQHALMRTWDHWEDQHTPDVPLDLEHYEEIGGMAQALSLHADQIYLSFSNQESRKIIETIFKRLTERGVDNREIRRPCSVAELGSVTRKNKSELIPIINRFRERGVSYLMPPLVNDLQEDTIIDISQESLMRIWGRLQSWMDEEAEAARDYIRLSDRAQAYEEGKAALMRDLDLKIALNWKRKYENNFVWAERYTKNFVQVIEFIKKSADQNTEAENSRRKTNNTLFLKKWIIPYVIIGFFAFILLYATPNAAMAPSLFPILALIVIGGYTVGAIRIVNQSNQALVERLGRYHRKLRPGLNFIVPFLDTIVWEESIRERMLDVLPLSITTHDNFPLDIDAVVYWKIMDLERTYYEIENVSDAIREVVVAALRSEIGKISLSHVFGSRNELNQALLDILDEATEPWGVKVTRVEVQDISPSTYVSGTMQEQARKLLS
ncbi:SPFH domain-containing protein [Halomicronema sp. CCY15110]|uniref:SPFH domain-containing protein n=1 Tax=Halomicronema sp. CCY15110 TaxID=2767773 RepID=UPI001EF2CB4E|nr:SPFH domain-containing protein [Halomicronema sp. CCY15110]